VYEIRPISFLVFDPLNYNCHVTGSIDHYYILQIIYISRKIERFLSQSFFVAEVFTGFPGKYVGLAETIRGFKLILSGELDSLPEQAFYLVGNIDKATAKATNLEIENNLKKWS